MVGLFLQRNYPYVSTSPFAARYGISNMTAGSFGRDTGYTIGFLEGTETKT